MAQYNPLTGITSYTPTDEQLSAEAVAPVTADTAPAAPEASTSFDSMFQFRPDPMPNWQWDEANGYWINGDEIAGPESIFDGGTFGRARKFYPEIRDEDGRVDQSARGSFGGATPQYLQLLWATTPGSAANKFTALSSNIGAIPAMQWLQQAGVPMTQADVDAIMGSGELIAAQQHMQSRAGQGMFGGIFKPVLDLAADLDLTGLAALALGDPNPHGFLGLQLDPLADLTGTRPEELAMIGRLGAGTLNPVVGLGMQVAPAAAGRAEFDPRQIAQNAAISAGTGAAIGAVAPYVGDWFDSMKKFFGGMDFGLNPADADAIHQAALESAADLPEYETLPGMSMPAAIPEIDGTFGGLTKTGMMSPAMAEADPTFGGALTETAPGVFSTEVAPPISMPAAVPEADPSFGGALAPTDIGVYDAAAATDPAAAAKTSPETVKRYAKVAQTVHKMLNSDGSPEGAPQRTEDVTDEQYAEQLVEYANLDAEAMAEQGFVPGTRPYYEHIMGQMDSIINQVLEGMDVDSDALADQLRTKTEEEIRALERALFVRGQMEQLMGSGTYTDPATGLDEEVLTPDGMLVNPGRGAYQRGLARNANDLGRLRGAEARKFLGSLLERDVDWYGMQGRADERALDEQFLLEDDERKRRRGMFGGF